MDKNLLSAVGRSLAVSFHCLGVGFWIGSPAWLD